MRVINQRLNGGALLVVGSPLRHDLGIVVDLKNGKAFHKGHTLSIIMRGYWGKVTATKEEQDEAVRLAKIQAGKPSLIQFPPPLKSEVVAEA